MEPTKSNKYQTIELEAPPWQPDFLFTTPVVIGCHGPPRCWGSVPNADLPFLPSSGSEWRADTTQRIKLEKSGCQNLEKIGDCKSGVGPPQMYEMHWHQFQGHVINTGLVRCLSNLVVFLNTRNPLVSLPVTSSGLETYFPYQNAILGGPHRYHFQSHLWRVAHPCHEATGEQAWRFCWSKSKSFGG